MKRALFLACLALTLAGCGEQAVPVASVPPPPPLKDRIPAYLKQCQDEPDGKLAMSNEDAAEYIEDLRDAGQDCRRKNKTLVRIIQAESGVAKDGR